MNSFLREVVHRAAAAAEEDGDSSVNGVHLETNITSVAFRFHFVSDEKLLRHGSRT